MAADPLPNRPPFLLPFPGGTRCEIKTYVGHNPDDKKMDIYAEGWPNDSAVLAAAAGLVHEHFDPGGIEINHGKGWFTTYMHMDRRAAIGTHVDQGDWVGRADTVGTGTKHLHHEQLYAGPGATDADNKDITYPVIQGQGPLHLVPGKTIVMVSTNRRLGPGHPPTNGKPAWPLPRNEYFGLISGPSQSHGGYYAWERPYVKFIQERLQAMGFAPRTPGWADGIFEQPTKDAVAAWQRAEWARFTTRYGEVWSDDWARL